MKQAISLVGIRTIKNFALWSAVFGLMPNPQCGPFDLRCLWQDSLRRGIFARRFAKVLGCAEFEDLFAAALLQDLAIPLLANELPEQYDKLLCERHGGHQRLSDLERDCFGWTHADAGAFIARTWHLPDSFASAISNHAECNELSDNAKTASVGLHVVQLSALLPAACDAEWPERDRFMALYDRMAMSCGDSVLPVLQLFDQVDREFVDVAPVVKLTRPARALSQFLQVETAGI